MILYDASANELVIPIGLTPPIFDELLTLQEKDEYIEQNGQYDIVPDSSFNGLSVVHLEVDVPTVVYNQDASLDITENGQYSLTYDSSHSGLGQVTVDVNVPVTTVEVQDEISVEINENGTHTIFPDLGYDALGRAYVDVSVNLATQSITVDPLDHTETYTPDPGYVAFDSVTVNAVDLERKIVDCSTHQQIVEPDSGVGLDYVIINPYVLDNKTVDASINPVMVKSDADGLKSVTVNAVRANIDPNIIPENIKIGVEILGVEGTMTGGDLQDKTVDSSTAEQIITNDSSYYGLSSVTINPYILDTSTLNVQENGNYTVTSAADGLSRVDVSVNIDTSSYYDAGYEDGSVDGYNRGYEEGEIEGYGNGYSLGRVDGIAEQKGKLTSVTFTQNGTYTRENGWNHVDVSVNNVNNQAKTVDSSTVEQIVTPDASHTGLSQVTVNPYTLETQSVVYDGNGSYTIESTTADGLSRVDVSVNLDLNSVYERGYRNALIDSPDILLSYLENDGSIYFDTGIPGASDTTIEIRFHNTYINSANYFLAQADQYGDKGYPIIGNARGDGYYGGGIAISSPCVYGNTCYQLLYANSYTPDNGVDVFSGYDTNIGRDHVVVAGLDASTISWKSQFIVDGSVYSKPWQSTGQRFTDNLYIFANNDGANNKITYCLPNTRIDYVKIWNTGNLVRFFVPVLHNVNNTYHACFYDKVTNTYIYKQGSGSVKYDVDFMQNHVYMLDYIYDNQENNVNDIAYDTGIRIQNGLSIDAKFNAGNSIANGVINDQVIVGYRYSGSYKTGIICPDKGYEDPTSIFHVGYRVPQTTGSPLISDSADASFGINYRVSANLNQYSGARQLWVNDTSTQTEYVDEANILYSYNMYLFGNPDLTWGPYKNTRLYYACIANPDRTANTSFIPVLVSGQPYFYDLNSKRYIRQPANVEWPGYKVLSME